MAAESEDAENAWKGTALRFTYFYSSGGSRASSRIELPLLTSVANSSFLYPDSLYNLLCRKHAEKYNEYCHFVFVMRSNCLVPLRRSCA